VPGRPLASPWRCRARAGLGSLGGPARARVRGGVGYPSPLPLDSAWPQGSRLPTPDLHDRRSSLNRCIHAGLQGYRYPLLPRPQAPLLAR
jgi:hypothetical protein